MGLLNPANLLWALSIAVLLAIYLRSRSRPTLEVSSLLLFDEAPAPAARIRHLRLDLLFWLEVALVGALVLALAGLYVRTAPSPGRARSHALVFDLAAGMGARDGSGTRLDAARREALDIVDSAPQRDLFSVISYGLEAQVVHAETANRASLRSSIEALRPMAVAPSRAAIAAALMRASAAGEAELFSDRRPLDPGPRGAGGAWRLRFHPAGSPADNLAIVSLDPGIPGSSRGRAVIRNFSPHPRRCELAVESGGTPAFHQTLILAPREQIVAPFGPLPSGGLVHARILSADALEADNERFAYAPAQTAAHVLVLSPDATVRDDLARVLLAVNSNFIVATEAPAKYAASANGGDGYALAVMHDCYVPGVKTDAVLLIYPPASVSSAGGALAGIEITGSIASSRMAARESRETSAAPVLLGAARTMTIPQWMTIRALGATAATHETFPLAAIGSVAAGRVGLIAFDVRNHLLLDPDRLDALVSAVDLVRELTEPPELQITTTGTFLSIPASGAVKIVQPDGASVTASADRWGRVRLRPLEAGHYRVQSAARATEVYANYYDASESDLTASAPPSAPAPANPPPARMAVSSAKQVQPLTALLIVLALAALLAESAMLLRHAGRWGMRHV